MKKLLVLIFSLATVAGNAQTTRLKLASDAWPPFTDVDSARAFALDLVKEALARTKVEEHTSILDFKQVMEGISNGTFDGSAALWRSPEREAYLLYSEPYLENRLILVGKKGSDVSATSLVQLNGKRIAVVGSYAYGALPGDVQNITLVPGNSDQQNLRHLLDGKADYMLVDALLIQYLLEYQSKEAAEYLQIGTHTMLTLTLHFAIRKDITGAENIIKNFNAEIKKMIAEGVYNKILQLNWIATDVDGDGRAELVLNGDQAGTNAPVNSYVVISNADKAAGAANGYYIQGIRYEDWKHVPQKYKVPQGKTAELETRGLGPAFNF